MTSVALPLTTEPIYHPIRAHIPAPSNRCLTDAKIKRVGYTILAQAALVLAGFLIATAVMGFMATPAGWITLGMIAVSALAITILGGAALYRAVTLKDYEDPRELTSMKEQAVEQNFQTLYKEHGPKNLVKYIFNENKPELSLNALRNKLKEEVKTLDFQTVSWLYNVSLLRTFSIAPVSWAQFTLSKIEQLKEARQKQRKEAHEISQRYPYRTKKLEGIVRDARGKIEWSYTFANLFRDIKNKALESFCFRTANSLGEAAIHYAIHQAEFPDEQQVLYDGEMARITTELGTTIKKLRDEYLEQHQNHLN